MTNRHMNLFFPQWQGSGISKRLFYSALDIRDRYLRNTPCEEVHICETDKPASENGIHAYREVLNQFQEATRILGQRSPETVFTIGGDCGVAPAPISYLNMKHGGKMAVVWFDAHADLNTPDTSPSSRFHGMPLRHLLGEGEQALTGGCFSHLKPSQLLMVGLRDPDVPEQEFIQKSGIRVVSASSLESGEADIAATLRSMGYDRVHVHVDCDVLDPHEFPSVLVPEPEGLSLRGLHRALDGIRRSCRLVGFSVTEYCEISGPSHIHDLEYLVSVGANL